MRVAREITAAKKKKEQTGTFLRVNLYRICRKNRKNAAVLTERSQAK